MIRSAFLHGFDWSGRARRRDLWAFAGFALVVLGSLAGAEVWLSDGAPAAPRLVFLPAALLVVPLISLGIRRLHDRGHGGGWLVLALLPVLGWSVLAYLLIAPANLRASPPDTPAALQMAGGVMAAVVVLLVASRAFWAPYWMVSGSMKPGFLVGDYLVAGFAQAADLARGDVVVFRDPVAGRTLVSRLIGLPGDRVQLLDGQIMLNGQAVPQTPLAPMAEVFAPQGPLAALPRCGNAPVGAGGQCITAQFHETLPGGQSHAVLDLIPSGPMDDTAVVTVPPERYFMLGDNRDDSADSRFATSTGGMGFVAAHDVIGRVNRVLLSADGVSPFAFWRWRAGRYWVAVP